MAEMWRFRYEPTLGELHPALHAFCDVEALTYCREHEGKKTRGSKCYKREYKKCLKEMLSAAYRGKVCLRGLW